ncbi:MAG: FAD-dependent oxidoreductase [Burkholderiaceae bacterium]
MSPHFSTVVVLGAGLIGRLLAWVLAQRGHVVDLYDAGGPAAEQSAATVAAAMLAPLAESAVTEPGVVRMGQYALQRWPELIADLPENVFFQQQGTLIVWHRQDAPEAQRLRARLAHTAQQIPELPPARDLDARSLSAVEPALSGRFAQGLLLPDEGQLDNRQLLKALTSAIDQAGVRCHWNTPRSPADIPAHSDGGPSLLLDCRGLGARSDWQKLRGVRGEVVRIHAPDVQLQRPTRLVHPRYPIYIAPKPNGVFVIGATEIESEDRSPVSVRSTLELLSAAYAVHPGFAEARVIEAATQCRPTLPDNLPALRIPRPGVLEVNGLYRHGFMIAPAMLDCVLQWLECGHSTLARRFDLNIETLASHALA